MIEMMHTDSFSVRFPGETLGVSREGLEDGENLMVGVSVRMMNYIIDSNILSILQIMFILSISQIIMYRLQ